MGKGLSAEQIAHQENLLKVSKKIASLLAENEATFSEVEWVLKNVTLYLRVAIR